MVSGGASIPDAGMVLMFAVMIALGWRLGYICVTNAVRIMNPSCQKAG